MITDAEIEKIFDWADANKVVGKRWKKQKWGINLVDDEIDSVKKGIPRDRDTLLKITHLNLSKSKLLDIPVELYKLIKLQKLDISNIKLKINTMGDGDSRTSYVSELQDYLDSRIKEIPEGIRARVASNPLRVLDSKDPKMSDITNDAP
ncbi:MAG TPA: hypothetical protein EYP02_08280, partial [Sulfurovum sp.]|nr:hypothetical protein [Sulfurovum sp.]